MANTINQNAIFWPNVSQVPPKKIEKDDLKGISSDNAADNVDFSDLLDQLSEAGLGKKDLSQAREPLKFSAHATQRLKDRNINLNPEMMGKLSDAVDKAASKGVEDSLIMSDQGAFIVNTKNRTVVTALDKGSMNGNVFTHIDGAVWI